MHNGPPVTFQQFPGQGLRPGINNNVINVLRELLESGALILIGKYSVFGKVIADADIIHLPGESTHTPVTITSHRERFNFSLTTKKDVKRAPEGGMIESEQIYRSFHIIRDGQLHMTELKAIIPSEESFKKLRRCGRILASEAYSRTKIYTVSLTNIQLVSPAWANPGMLKFVPLLKFAEDLKLSAEQNKELVRGHGYTGSFAQQAGTYKEKKDIPAKEREIIVEHVPHDIISLRGYCAITFMPEANIIGPYYTAALMYEEMLRQVRFNTRLQVFAMHKYGPRIPWTEGDRSGRGHRKLIQTAEFGDETLVRITWVGPEKRHVYT